jgi:hypothetical protein
MSLSTTREPASPNKNARHARSNGLDVNIIRMKQASTDGSRHGKESRESIKTVENESSSILKLNKIESDYKLDSDESEIEEPLLTEAQEPYCAQINFSSLADEGRRQEAVKAQAALNSQLLQVNFNSNYTRFMGKQS